MDSVYINTLNDSSEPNDPDESNQLNALNDPNDPNDKKMIRTQIQLHPEQVKWLKKVAMEKGVSMAQVIRDSIDFYWLYTKKTQERNVKKKKALKAVGRFTTNSNKV